MDTTHSKGSTFPQGATRAIRAARQPSWGDLGSRPASGGSAGHSRMEGVLTLQEIASSTVMDLSTESLLRMVMENVTRALEAERSTLFLVDRARGVLWSKIAQGLGVQEIRMPLGSGIAGFVADSGETVNIGNAYSDPRFNPEVDGKTGYLTRSVLSMALRDPRGQIVAVIQVLNKRGGAFTAPDEETLAKLCSQAAILVSALSAQQTEHA
ncbi:MAG: GAF domain-containing protein [Chloroflexi bacterium]|nr:GAF domain-containing protein [Chloroflexota bacterium]